MPRSIKVSIHLGSRPGRRSQSGSSARQVHLIEHFVCFQDGEYHSNCWLLALPSLKTAENVFGKVQPRLQAEPMQCLSDCFRRENTGTSNPIQFYKRSFKMAFSQTISGAGCHVFVHGDRLSSSARYQSSIACFGERVCC